MCRTFFFKVTTGVLLTLIWLQIVHKDLQQTTKVITRGDMCAVSTVLNVLADGMLSLKVELTS